MFDLKSFKKLDYTLIISVIILIIWGLILIYSVTYKSAQEIYNDQFYFLKRQLIWFIIGIFFLLFFISIDYDLLFGWLSLMAYFIILILLLIVYFLGSEVLGARRWLSFGVVSIQPSEFAKLGVIIILASFFTKVKDNINQFKYFFLSLLITILPIILIFKQPDLGTAIVIFIVWFTMLLFAGFRLKYIIPFTIIGIISTPLLWQLLRDYQKRRLLAFLDPNIDPLGSGYHLIQSKIAIGSGGIFGQGLFSGKQIQLDFIPGIHTDFIFSSVGEQFGFIGCCIVLILYIIILIKALEKAYLAKDFFGYLLSMGITTMFLIHIFINIGMTIGIMPITGLPLPFLSYGGSSLIVNMIGIALLINIDLRRKKTKFGYKI